MSLKQLALPSALAVVIVVFAFGMLYQKQRDIDTRVQAIQNQLAVLTHQRAGAPVRGSGPSGGGNLPSSFPLTDAHLKGNPDARVILIEFADFQCPACSQFARQTFASIDQKFVETGKVRVGFQHLPLTTLHPAAARAADAAECANSQHHFWDMYSALFSSEMKLDEPGFAGAARTIGLDMPLFKACMGREPSAVIARQASQAQQLGINSTPTFLLGLDQSNGAMTPALQLKGAASDTTMTKAIEQVLAQAANTQK